jgi:hypothetical protein
MRIKTEGVEVVHVEQEWELNEYKVVQQSCRMRIEGVRSTMEYENEKEYENKNWRSTKEYNRVSLQKEDLMCAVVTVRLLTNPLPEYD